MHNLSHRIKALPASKIKQLREHVVTNSIASRATYYRFLGGTSPNIRIAQAMAGFLGTSLENLLDPDFDLGTNSKPAIIISKKQPVTPLT